MNDQQIADPVILNHEKFFLQNVSNTMVKRARENVWKVHDMDQLREGPKARSGPHCPKQILILEYSRGLLGSNSRCKQYNGIQT